MAEVLLFHHALGRTAGVTGFADRFREAGHVVHLPDLFDGDRHRARCRCGDAELFLYPGDEHYFADSTLPSFDPDSTELLFERALGFLARV